MPPGCLFYDSQNIALSYNDVFLSIQLYFCSCIFGIDNFVSYSNFHLHFFAFDYSTRSYSDNFCLLWFFLRLSRKYDTGFCCFFCF